MSESITGIRRLVRDYARSIAFWVPVGVLVGWQTYEMYRAAPSVVSLQAMLLAQAKRYLIIAMMTPPVFYCVFRWPVTSTSIQRVAAYVIGCVPFTLLFVFVCWSLPRSMHEAWIWFPRDLSTLYLLTSGNFADLMQLYLAIVVAAHAYAYFVRGKRQEIERLELRQALAQSELPALRAQLHPHFLFNTLQGVSTLIDTDRKAAQSMLSALAGLLRTALTHGSADLVSFREELEFAKAYLELEKMRLGKRLAVRWDIAPETGGTLIPQLLLQPLIENAIVHGVANSLAGGWIELQARVEDGRLRVWITNSVAGATPRGSGVGLTNTRARLKYLFDEDGRFEFQRSEGPGTATAVVDLPALFTVAGTANTPNAPSVNEQQCAS
jgi:two-component system LytT family sensor kinase